MGKVYVIGHLNPDTDTIVSAMAMAEFLNRKNNTSLYEPAMTGKPNSETEYIFKRFNADFPTILEDAQGKELFLVDHNEESQRVKNAETEKIVGFIDHHKVKFECSKPIDIIVKPYGSTTSMIYELFKLHNIEIPEKLKPLMLCAVLSDTVILKSPTTTDVERNMVKELADELGLNYEELGMEMFKAKSRISEKTPEEIVKNDFKIYDIRGKKVGIGQVETPDLSEIESRKDELLNVMKEIMEKENYHTIALMLTDIINEGSKLLIVSNELEKVKKMFNVEFEGNLSAFIPGMMSRKKQVAPVFSENL